MDYITADGATRYHINRAHHVTAFLWHFSIHIYLHFGPWRLWSVLATATEEETGINSSTEMKRRKKAVKVRIYASASILSLLPLLLHLSPTLWPSYSLLSGKNWRNKCLDYDRNVVGILFLLYEERSMQIGNEHIIKGIQQIPRKSEICSQCEQ